MKSIRIQNLRCLTDTGTVPLKPINLLVGANSAGKSTFLRTFPLLKQGNNKRKKGPILWFGDEVDFGDFKTSVRSGSTEIHLEFTIKTASHSKQTSHYYERHFVEYNDIAFKIHLTISQIDEYEYISKIKIDFLDYYIALLPNKNNEIDRIFINDLPFDIDKPYKLLLTNTLNGLFDIFVIEENEHNTLIPIRYFQSPLLKYAIRIMRKYTGNRVKDDKILNLVNLLKLSSREELFQQINTSAIRVSAQWHKETKEFSKDSPILRDCVTSMLLSKFSYLLHHCNTRLSEYLSNIHYIAPLRATAQRYYRTPNLAISEIDSTGQNLALYLQNLTSSELKAFQTWLTDHFDFYVESKLVGGHISLYLNHSKETHNMADSGFGYSQILPILAKTWSIFYRKRSKQRNRFFINSAFIVIEQPELHLHPKLQSLLIRTFVSIANLAKKKNVDLKFVIETHSPTIVNKLGELVSKGEITPEEVSLAMFAPSESNTSVKLTTYNEEGVLVDWPFGFFDY